MSTSVLELTSHDPLIARDGRPFGNQGQRMRGLPWLSPSVVAGSFRTALVKSAPGLDFTGDMPQRLKEVEVAGVLPVHDSTLYLPAPSDAVAEPMEVTQTLKAIHRVTPQTEWTGGSDIPHGLAPVMLPDGAGDFKPAAVPAWWPLEQYAEWLTTSNKLPKDWFGPHFLRAAQEVHREHVSIDAECGAAAESMIFTTVGLNLSYLPRFGVDQKDRTLALCQKYADITLTARIEIPTSELDHAAQFDIWHPLGGERRLVHWGHHNDTQLWTCPECVKQSLEGVRQIRMVLATPAIFAKGWKPGWLDEQCKGSPPGVADVKLKLIGVVNHRWKAISGWSLASPRGPKAIRRMVPAGSVYFFRVEEGDPARLADRWLQSVSDDSQEQRDGFGLAVWGTWS